MSEPLDAAAMADAIERVLDDRELAASCAARGIERARHYSWESSATALVAAYQEAVTQRAKRNDASRLVEPE